MTSQPKLSAQVFHIMTSSCARTKIPDNHSDAKKEDIIGAGTSV
jgi:hypothetical protein